MASPLQFTLPPALAHPRKFVRNAGQDPGLDFLYPTVAVLQTRILTGGAAGWADDYFDLCTYADSHINDANSFFIGTLSGSDVGSGRRDPEFSGMYAFCAMIQNYIGIGPTGTGGDEYSDKANSIADSLIAAKPSVLAEPSDSRNKIQREHGEAAAQIYDWNYPQLDNGSASRKNNLYLLIKDYAQDLINPSDNEYLWGVVHGDLCYAAQMLPVILNDSTSGNNASCLASWNEILNALDPGVAAPGTKQLGYWPVFRHFGNADGGTHKGSAPGGYDTIQSEFYLRLMHTFRTALDMDVLTTEPWFRRASDWKLWHYRPDRTFFRQHENDAINAFSQFTQAHAYMSAGISADSQEKNRWRWLAEEIQAANNGLMFGGYHLWRIIWDQKNPTAPTLPTLADSNGGNVMKFFKNAGVTIWREGFSPTDFVLRLNSEPFFTGDHQKRSNGAVQWAHNKAAMCVQAGNYDKDQDFTYKALDSGGTIIQGTESGHRWPYGKRIASQSTTRIMSSSEPASNELQSFRRTTTSSTSRFGKRLGTNPVTILNVGDQLWPKNFAASGNQIFQPGSLGDLFGDASPGVWQYSPSPYPLPGGNPIETAAYAYQVTDITGSYWAGKITRFRRHVLWIKAGQLPPWPRPVVMVWDDIVSPIDGTFGKKTQVQQWQLLASPSGSVASVFQITRTAAGVYPGAPTPMDARTFIKVMNPPTAESTIVQGYRDANNELFPATDQDDLLDTGQAADGVGGLWRLDINPASGTTTPDFLVLICPRASSAIFDLTTALINNGTKIGATLNGVDCTITRGTGYLAEVGGSGGAVPPPIADLGGFSGDARVDLQWSDTTDPTFTKYRVYRSQKVAGVYGAFAQIAEPLVSEYADTTAANGVTYRYKVTVFNPTGESADSNIVQELTPQAPVVFDGTIPWKTQRFTPRYRDSQQ